MMAPGMVADNCTRLGQVSGSVKAGSSRAGSVSAVLNRDFPVMQCFTLLLTTLLVLCNLVVDICYAWLDPRTRFSGVMA